VQHWLLLCNGFDLRGWYGTDLKAFAAVDGGVDCDSSRRVKTDQKNVSFNARNIAKTIAPKF
jgi:hypothetical protein